MGHTLHHHILQKRVSGVRVWAPIGLILFKFFGGNQNSGPRNRSGIKGVVTVTFGGCERKYPQGWIRIKDLHLNDAPSKWREIRGGKE